MTANIPDPAARRRISSTPILRSALTWGLIVGAVVAAALALVGGLVAGAEGAWSGVLGALVGIVFPAFTVEWLERGIFALAVIVAAIASLVVDLVVLSRMRLSGASDVALPTRDTIQD